MHFWLGLPGLQGQLHPLRPILLDGLNWRGVPGSFQGVAGLRFPDFSNLVDSAAIETTKVADLLGKLGTST